MSAEHRQRLRDRQGLPVPDASFRPAVGRVTLAQQAQMAQREAEQQGQETESAVQPSQPQQLDGQEAGHTQLGGFSMAPPAADVDFSLEQSTADDEERLQEADVADGDVDDDDIYAE